jgi:hypothetical protein
MYKGLCKIQFHSQVGCFKSQLFIKPVGVFSGEVGCQLDDVSITLASTFDCPFHHPAAYPKISAFLIYAHRLDLGSQATLITDRGKEHQVQCADHLPIQLCHDQLMIGITCNLAECRIIGLRQRIFIFFALHPQLVISKHPDNEWQVVKGRPPKEEAFTHSARSCRVSSAYSGWRRMKAAA